ncbi:hypothetical protein TKK_0006981 [Trichogramma kaykai]
MDGTTFKVVCCCCSFLLLQLSSVSAVRYIDDTDYSDFEFYKDLPEHQMAADQPPRESDFYIESEEVAKHQHQRNRHDVATNNDRDRIINPADSRVPVILRDGQPLTITLSEFVETAEKQPPADRIYRYTKHRIPGYDYEELAGEYSNGEYARKYQRQRCDDRSVWTHCLCQFTCSQPSVVDCYTPCAPGCECKEDYVYDEKARRCVTPEQCQPDDDYLIYR